MTSALALSLLLATAPADAPIEQAVEARTAIIELLDHNFVSRGPGCWVDAPRCVEVGRILKSARVRNELMLTETEPVPVGYVIAASVGILLGLVGGGYIMLKACAAVPSLCR